MSRVAIVGAGWAGLSAAVAAVGNGHDVHVYEMAHRGGGRARSHDASVGRLDNGQHLLIGAYTGCLDLMRTVGVDTARALRRSTLVLRYPDGSGLQLPQGSPALAFVRGVLVARHWPVLDRLALLSTALRWRMHRFECAESATVDDLCKGLPAAVFRDLIEPLCVAALNTPAKSASARVFLRVLKDALFGGAGSSDLLLPRVPLSALLAEPAARWLAGRGVALHWGHRAMHLVRAGSQWEVDGRAFDAVILACTAREASRMVGAINADWSRRAADIEYEPIVTVWLRDASLRWPEPMMALRSDDVRPAQFGIDLGALDGPGGCFAFVLSGARAWVARGLTATTEAVLAQARVAFPGAFASLDPVVHACAERRATFCCRPGLARPALRIAPQLFAAGDYVEGPYPATLEGAVRSGALAVNSMFGSA